MASSSDEQPKPPEMSSAAGAAAAVPGTAVAVAAPPQSHAEWAASLQAYYAAAGHPYAWPAQVRLLAPYQASSCPPARRRGASSDYLLLAAAAAAGAPFGTPVPFPVYHPGAAVAYYAHASMAAGVPYPTSEAVAAAAAAAAEGKGKGKGGAGSPEKGSSGAPSGEDASRSGDSGSEESSGTRDDDTDHKHLVPSAPKKRKSDNTSAEGEPSQAALVRYAAVESPYPVKGRSASKLLMSAPGRVALPNATPNLNIGMDLWSTSPALAVPAVQGEASPGLALARHDGVAQLDGRELKRERRKESNRESVRRSRLRKQVEDMNIKEARVMLGVNEADTTLSWLLSRTSSTHEPRVRVLWLLKKDASVFPCGLISVYSSTSAKHSYKVLQDPVAGKIGSASYVEPLLHFGGNRKIQKLRKHGPIYMAVAAFQDMCYNINTASIVVPWDSSFQKNQVIKETYVWLHEHMQDNEFGWSKSESQQDGNDTNSDALHIVRTKVDFIPSEMIESEGVVDACRSECKNVPIFVRHYSREVVLTVNLNESSERMMHLFEEKTKIKVISQYFSYGLKKIEPGHTLQFYGIGRNATVHLCGRLLGGKHPNLEEYLHDNKDDLLMEVALPDGTVSLELTDEGYRILSTWLDCFIWAFSQGKSWKGEFKLEDFHVIESHVRINNDKKPKGGHGEGAMEKDMTEFVVHVKKIFCREKRNSVQFPPFMSNFTTYLDKMRMTDTISGDDKLFIETHVACSPGWGKLLFQLHQRYRGLSEDEKTTWDKAIRRVHLVGTNVYLK